MTTACLYRSPGALPAQPHATRGCAPGVRAYALALVGSLLLLEATGASPAEAATRARATTPGTATAPVAPTKRSERAHGHADKRLRHAKKSAHQTGMASFYGREFEHRRTANGERFDPSQLTAAHRTLPFGTRVRVTNLDNGQRVVVRINDRGPYARGRVLDLSRAAARKLGFVQDGVAHVRLEVLRDHHGWRDPLADAESSRKGVRGQRPRGPEARRAATRKGSPTRG